jgi:uncharacterized protein YydD (DUF2326 family)
MPSISASQDKDRTKQVVDDVDERIAALNADRYSLNQIRKKMLASLEEDQILFNPDEAQRLFEEAGVLFKGQIKKDFQQLIAFNGPSRTSAAAISKRSSYGNRS